MDKMIVGLMSGTSLDGIDAALVKISGHGFDTRVALQHFISVPFSNKLKEELLDVMDVERSNVAKICSMNYKLGALFADTVKDLCEEAAYPIEKIDAIGSHGQTIYHIPNTVDHYIPSTLQIGEPSIIAYETNTTVISNFRAMDIAARGEGAPLVPYTEYLLYKDLHKGRALQNIGGIGNVTVIPKNSELNDVFAFDTGPGNMIIDELCKQLKGAAFDKNGDWASQGRIHKNLAAEWMEMAYFKRQPPKSTGRELFGRAFTKKILQENRIPANDFIATATYFTAVSIADTYKRFVFPAAHIDEIIVAGGGSYNITLMNMLKSLLPGKNVLTQEDIGLSSEAKEAIAFAILANETLHQHLGNVMQATGARESVILGQITLPPNGDPHFMIKAGKDDGLK